MALKYFLEFVDFQNGFWRIEIDSPNYTDEPIRIEGGENPLVLEWNGNSDDDIFKMHVIPSSATITAISTGIDLEELSYINDSSYKVRVMKDDGFGALFLYWSGWMVSDGIQGIDSGIPYDVTLKAIDGLEILSNKVFSWYGFGSKISVNGVLSANRSPINAYRSILMTDSFISSDLRFRWNTSLKNDFKPTEDMIAGTTQIDAYGESYFNEKKMDLFSENLSKSCISWLFQSDGSWYVENYFDSLSGTFNGWEITGDTSTDQSATYINESSVQQLLPTDTINENWFWFGKKPYGGVSVLYKDSKYDGNNVIPNGNFSRVSLGSPLFWHYDFNPGNKATYQMYDELDNGAVELVFPSDGTEDEYAEFSFQNEVSIDSSILFKDFTFEFTLLPFSGFPYVADGDDKGIIDWTSKPLQAMVRFHADDGVDYYLNEFGYWQRLPAVAFLNMNIVNITPKKWKYEFSGSPIAGNIVKYRYKYSNLGVDSYIEASYVVKPSDEFGLSILMQSIADSLTSQLQPSANWIVTYDSNSVTVENTFSGTIINEGSLVNSQSDGINEDGYMSISAQGTANGDLINIVFQGKGTNNSRIKFPKKRGFLKVSFKVKEGQRYIISNVNLNVSDANEICEISVPSTNNDKVSYEIGISSGFSGFMYTSYGDRYDDIHNNEFWNGGKTLTELYGRAIIDTRNRGIRVFSGDIDKVMNWGLFSLMGKVYAPLSLSVNIKDMISKVVGAEFTPSSVDYNVEYKSSEGAN